MNMNETVISERKKKFKEGDRVVLHSDMIDDHNPILKNTKGTVKYVDDIGTIHIKWDNGRSLGAVLKDVVIKIKE